MRVCRRLLSCLSNAPPRLLCLPRNRNFFQLVTSSICQFCFSESLLKLAVASILPLLLRGYHQHECHTHNQHGSVVSSCFFCHFTICLVFFGLVLNFWMLCFLGTFALFCYETALLVGFFFIF